MNRFYFAALIFAIVLSATAKSAVSQAQSAEYPDVPREHWAFEVLNKASQSGSVEGHPDGLFRGEQALTRYEFSVAFARLSTTSVCYAPGPRHLFRLKSLDELEKDRLFPSTRSTDVSRGHYAYEAVQLVQRLGIMQGDTNNQFLGDKPLTRYEFVTALARLRKLLDTAYVP
ncbi:MAG TPA: S-layer homology domain-containing protein [Abditibacteriaceae bacterium]|jgi:hypothetical protein